MPETTVTVKAVATKTGEKNGKKWHKWSFCDDQDNWYSTFVGAMGEKFVKGTTLTVEYEQTDYGRDVKKVVVSGANPPQVDNKPDTAPALNGGPKDRAIIRQVAWKAAAQLLSGREWKTDTELFATAVKLAHGIEHDICRESALAVNEADDIPFMPTVMGNEL